jgi:uncharacterized membrane protein YqjE
MTAGLLESARSLLAGILELGRTRFELFSTELREELSRLAAAIIGGLAILVFGAIGLAFGAAAIIMSVDDSKRVPVTLGVTLVFLLAAGFAAWRVHRLATVKERPFEATISELRQDLEALKR